MGQIIGSVTVTRPPGGWVDDRVVQSSIQQAGGSVVGARVTVIYEDITQQSAPLGNPGFTLAAVVEEQVAPGVYAPLASQFQPINADTGQKTTQVLILTQQPVFDQGVPEHITSDTSVSRTQIDRLPGKYRVCVVRREIDPAKADLEELTVSVYVTES
jgi:hypothetical protein